MTPETTPTNLETATRRPPTSNAAEVVRGIRQQLSMTQEELAHELGATVSTVSRWENGHARPSALAWKALRELLTRSSGPANPEER